MSLIGEMIAAPGRLALMYTERLLQGVSAEQFARYARPGGTVVESNHPAFILGHLAMYPQRVVAQLGRPVGDAAVPAEWESLFKAGVNCQDDPDGRIYPPMQTIVDRYFAAYRAALAAIESASEEQFAAPNPAEGRLRELFPKLGSALTFYVVGHTQSHLGQFSAWRRAMGLPAAM